MHTFLRGIRTWLKKHRSVSAETVIRHLNPVLRGWANYYKHANSKQTFNYVDAQIWRAIWNWCLKRHRNKSKAWVRRKYFTGAQNRSWMFFAKVPGHGVGSTSIFLFNCSKILVKSHVKVKGAASPDDPDLRAYWQKRRYGRKRAGLSEEDVTVPWLLGA
jgi:RNA-directed DNA polymerase